MTTTILTPHTVGVEAITPLLRGIRTLPPEATQAVVHRNASGRYVWPHATDRDGDVHAIAEQLARQLEARLLIDGKPAPVEWPPKPKPGVCPDCGLERKLSDAVSRKTNLCPCKRKAGTR